MPHINGKKSVMPLEKTLPACHALKHTSPHSQACPVTNGKQIMLLPVPSSLQLHLPGTCDSTSAPAASNSCAADKWPALQAQCSAEPSYGVNIKLTSAPASNSLWSSAVSSAPVVWRISMGWRTDRRFDMGGSKWRTWQLQCRHTYR